MDKIDLNLKGKTIVITGAGGVICASIAEALAQSGASLALLDINPSAAAAAALRVSDAGGVAKGYACDVLDKGSLHAARAQIEKDFGKCDILINGAGGNNPLATTDIEFNVEACEGLKDFFALDAEGIKFVFDLNFIGTFLPTQAFAEGMRGRSGCCVLNISSMNAFRPLTKIPAYSAAKAAVSNFTQWLAVHFAKDDIRVNAIAPGFFVTNQNRKLLFGEDGTPTARTGKILSATPMGRFGEVEEINGAVKFLLSQRLSGFITGIVLPIDGGFNAYSGV